MSGTSHSAFRHCLICRLQRRFDMTSNNQDHEKLAQYYDKLARQFNELYLAGKERGREAMQVALEKAHKELSALG